MILRRERTALVRRDLVAAALASVYAGVWTFLPRRIYVVVFRMIGLLEVLGVFVLCHLPPREHRFFVAPPFLPVFDGDVCKHFRIFHLRPRFGLTDLRVYLSGQ